MTRSQARDMFASDDLIGIAAQADAVRRQLHPEGVVTYCTDADDTGVTLTIQSAENAIEMLDDVGDATAIAPVCSAETTAVEYLKLIALCRLYLDIPHIQVAHERTGLKVGQLALRFGADDFGVVRRGGNASEEEIRAAYLRKVKEHPPERSPEEFERTRDAYEALRDPRRRMRNMLLAADPAAPLTGLLDGRPPQRRFTGPGPWLEVLKGK